MRSCSFDPRSYRRCKVILLSMALPAFYKFTDVFLRDNMGNTPLHLASFSGRIDCAGLLIEAGSDVNMKNIIGAAPFARPNEGELMFCWYTTNQSLINTYNPRAEANVEVTTPCWPTSRATARALCDEGRA